MERVERRDGEQDARIRARAEALAGKSYSDDAFRIRPVVSASEMVEEAESTTASPRTPTRWPRA